MRRPCVDGPSSTCARVSGSVVDASGGSIIGARVSASDARGVLVAEGSTDVAGQFRLVVAPGLARITARADGYSEHVQPIEAPLEGLRLVLAPESAIAGRVVVEGTEQPVAGALVTAVNQDGPPTEPRAARTLSDGTFRVTGLLAGRHSIVAVAQQWRGEPQDISVGVGETIEALELGVRAATPVRGVVQVGGASCPRGGVFLQGDINLYSGVAPDGSVVFDGVPPGPYTVDVRCIGAFVHNEPLDVGSEPLTRTWDLDAGLALRGSARTAADAPLAEAPIEVVAVGEPVGRAGTSCITDEQGEFSCSGLEPGDYDCVIGSGVPSRSDSVRVAVSADGTPRVVLRAYAEGSIRVRVEGSTDLELRSLAVVARSPEQLLVAEPRGSELVFEPVRLGAYEIALDSEEPGSGRRVELTQPGEVAHLNLSLPASQTISGRVVDEAGQGVPDAWVTVAGTSPFAQLRPSTPVLTDADGGFAIPGLLPARYQLTASSGRRIAELELESDSHGAIMTLRDAPTSSASNTTPEDLLDEQP